MKKVKTILIILIVLAVLGAGGYAIWKYVLAPTKTASGETVYVQSVAVLAGLETAPGANRYTGEVVSGETLKIELDSSQTLKEILVSVGDEVNVGDPLFSYDTEAAQMSIEQAELELELTTNSIEDMKVQIQELTKQKEKANAREQLTLSIEILSLENSIKQEEFNIKSKTAEIERMKESLDNSVVYATLSGIVQSINKPSDNSNGYDYDYNYNEGSSGAFMTILETSDYRIKGSINEQNVWTLPVGSDVIVRSRVNETTWTGYIDSIDTENPSSGNDNYYYEGSGESTTSYPFYVHLYDSEGLMMGQHVTIEPDFGQTETKEGIWLPADFIVDADTSPYVFAEGSDERLEKRSVTLGEFDDMLYEYQIVSGLTADDYIAFPEEGMAEGSATTHYMVEDPEDYEDYPQENVEYEENLDEFGNDEGFEEIEEYNEFGEEGVMEFYEEPFEGEGGANGQETVEE